MNLDAEIYARHTQPMQSHINVGFGEDVTIADLARLIGKVVGYGGEIAFDPTKPDGTPRKLMDSSRLENLGWRAAIGLEAGLAATYKDFLANHDKALRV